MKIMLVFPAFFEGKKENHPNPEQIMNQVRNSLDKDDKLHAILLDNWLSETKDSADLMQLFVRFIRETADYDIIHTFSGLPLMMRTVLAPLLIHTAGCVDEWIPLPKDAAAGSAKMTFDEITEDALSCYTDILLNRKKEDDRPWGYWESLYLGSDFKVKHIYAAPDEMLSLQRHQHRTEVWTIVDGSGTITLGEKIIPVSKGETITIEKEAVHRAVGGPKGLHIIEIQFGDYLGEDDIERLEDKYGRTK